MNNKKLYIAPTTLVADYICENGVADYIPISGGSSSTQQLTKEHAFDDYEDEEW